MFAYMTKRDPPHGTIPVSLQRELSVMLSRALENHDDFVLAWEPRPGEDPAPGIQTVAHIMTGNLITSCRLNALLGRVMVYEDEGARSVTVPLNNVRIAGQSGDPSGGKTAKTGRKKRRSAHS